MGLASLLDIIEEKFSGILKYEMATFWQKSLNNFCSA